MAFLCHSADIAPVIKRTGNNIFEPVSYWYRINAATGSL